MTRKLKITPQKLYDVTHSHLYYLRDSIAEGVNNEREMIELEEFDACFRFIESLFDYNDIPNEFEIELGSDYTRELRDNLNLPEPGSTQRILEDTKNEIQVAIVNAKSLDDLKSIFEIYGNKLND